MLEISAENWKKPLIKQRGPQKLRPSKKETANILHCFNKKYYLANNYFSVHKKNRKKMFIKHHICMKIENASKDKNCLNKILCVKKRSCTYLRLIKNALT